METHGGFDLSGKPGSDGDEFKLVAKYGFKSGKSTHDDRLDTIRDVADDSVEAIVVDSESAFTRAKTFLQVVAPINAPKLLFYDRVAPIFDAFGVERQVEQIHAREVPLPSGGALVIDQTEAMVAIDVNSGRSRSNVGLYVGWRV